VRNRVSVVRSDEHVATLRKLDDMRWISPIQPAPDRRICKGHSVTSRKRSRKRRTGSHRPLRHNHRAFPKL
jgi:hypothetical protein